MASALSCTAWIVSCMSVLVTERIASRSLRSARPIISSLVVISGLLEGGSGRVEGGAGEAGQDEGADELPHGRSVGEVDRGRGHEGVRDGEAGDELSAGA